jgi:hypothetical protein
MPAIQVSRLKIQCAQLAECFSEPPLFVRGLHALLDFYADRTYRPGQAGKPPPLIKSYNAPLPVLRQLLRELVPLANADPQAALKLCDSLWAEPYLEFRFLAASLLGQVSPRHPEDILSRVRNWTGPKTEDRLLQALINTGLARVRREASDQYLNQLEAWLFSGDVLSQQLGLRALLPLVEDEDFENLPVVFRMLTLLVRIAPAALRPDLLEVLCDLARRSPQEVAFFMRQNLGVPESPDTPWLIRQILPAFSPEMQASLRQALREARQSP